MVADLTGYVTCGTPDSVCAKMMCWADDSIVYASSKCTLSLQNELERMSDRMIHYCKEVGLVINSDKTQILVSGAKMKDFSVRVGRNIVYPSKELNLLGVTYDTNFTTAPYLRKLASEAKKRAAVIVRLSYCVPPHLLRTFTNGLLVGKIMAAAPAAIPFRISHEDRGANIITEKINCALKSAARTITRIRLTDKVRSEIILEKAGLRELNEMVASSSAIMLWKSKMRMDPLGSLIFPNSNGEKFFTRSTVSNKAKLPVPGFNTLAVNHMARAWNDAPNLQNASTLGAAKSAARMWSRSLKFKI